MLYWFDKNGIWTIGANITDLNANAATNTSTKLTINTLTGFGMGPATLSWSAIAPGATNSTSTTVIILNNTGNQDFLVNNIKINSTDLIGESDSGKALHSGNFTISNTTSGGKAECDLSNVTASVMNKVSGAGYNTVGGANLSRGNYTVDDGRAQENLYVCLAVAGSELSSQAYSTYSKGAWTLSAT